MSRSPTTETANLSSSIHFKNYLPMSLHYTLQRTVMYHLQKYKFKYIQHRKMYNDPRNIHLRGLVLKELLAL